MPWLGRPMAQWVTGRAPPGAGVLLLRVLVPLRATRDVGVCSSVSDVHLLTRAPEDGNWGYPRITHRSGCRPRHASRVLPAPALRRPPKLRVSNPFPTSYPRRRRALPDGRSPQADPEPAGGDGECPSAACRCHSRAKCFSVSCPGDTGPSEAHLLSCKGSGLLGCPLLPCGVPL